MDVKTLCLGVLTERPMSGYEIKKHFEQAFQHFFLAGFGSIYPALAELARDGLVSVESVEQDKRPDKKVYRITARGWDALTEQLLAARPQPPRALGVPGADVLRASPAARARRRADRRGDRPARALPVRGAGAGRALHERAWGAAVDARQRFGLGYGRLMVSTALAYLQRQKGPLLRELEALRNTDTRAAAE